MFPKASQGDRFTKIWSKEFYNFLLSQIKQDLNLTHKQKSFTYDPVKALCKDDETILGFTPVALLEATQIRGGFKSPVIRIGELVENKAWGVLQSKCTQTQAADLVVAGVSWCNVTINSISHQFAKIEDNELVSQADEEDAVARIIAPIEEGPSLIQFPLPGKAGGSTTVIVIARVLTDVDHTTKTFNARIKATIAGPPQVFDTEITVENFHPGTYDPPTTTGDYISSTSNNMFLLLSGMNIIVVQSNTDTTSWPHSGAPKTGWFILQAPGTYRDCEEEPSDPETSDPPPP